MAGWLHGAFVVDWLFVFPLCGFSLSLFCNYKFAAGQHHAVLRVHFVSLFDLAFGLAFSGYVRHGDSCLTLQFTKLSTRDM